MAMMCLFALSLLLCSTRTARSSPPPSTSAGRRASSAESVAPVRASTLESLPPSVRVNLARLIQFGFAHPSATGAEELLCVEHLVRSVDVAFTKSVSHATRDSLWDTDNGLEPAMASALRARLSGELTERPVAPSTARACGPFDDAQRADLTRRIANAFSRAATKGSSAKFLPQETVADEILHSLFTPRYATVSFGIIMGTATLAAAMLIGAVLNRLLLRDRASSRPSRQEAFAARGLELGRHIGEGAFSEVYQCVLEEELCVVKMISVDIEEDLSELQEALDEARSLMELGSHPNVVRYRDVFVHCEDLAGETDAAPDPRRQNFVCIVMEWCEHGSLLDFISNNRMDLGGLVDVMRQVCSAVAFAHSQGVLHSDIKLENVLLTAHPDRPGAALVKIGDFGLATRLRKRSVQHEAPSRRRHDRLKAMGYASDVKGGTPNYMSPECWSDEALWYRDDSGSWATHDADSFGDRGLSTPERRRRFGHGFGAAVDVWSIGCLLWETVTGDELIEDPPFLGQRALHREYWDSEYQEVHAQFQVALAALGSDDASESASAPPAAAAAKLSALRSVVEETMCDILRRTLQPSPADRPSVEALVDGLSAFKGSVWRLLVPS